MFDNIGIVYTSPMYLNSMNSANGTPLHEASAIAESLKVKTLIKSGCVAKRNWWVFNYCGITGHQRIGFS